MRIEEASPSDHFALTSLMRQSKAFWKYDQGQLDRWQEELTISPRFIEQNNVIKASDGTKIVGFYAYAVYPKLVKLESLFVLPSHIGKGLGRLLMHHFLDQASAAPLDTIVLDADPHAEEFYRRFGFQTVSLKPTSISGRFLPIMVRRSSPSALKALFETIRLRVRHFTKYDLDDFYDMQRNPAVMKFVKPPLTYEQTVEELDRFIGYYARRDLLYRIWAVVDQSADSLVGLGGVYLNDQQELEIAYRLREKHWGRGYGREVARGLIDYCFTTLRYDELVAYVCKDNLDSIKILQQEMELRAEFYSEKDRWTEQVYRVSRKDGWQG